MYFKKILPIVISITLLILTIILTPAITSNTTTQNITEKETSKEFRGIWVTYIDLDMRNTDMTQEAFIKKFNKIADTSKSKGFNALIVQVRPFSDALYKSDYFPYSHLLTGVQGKDPQYDPLEYMCEYCHKIGLEIHAWINPYRIKTNNSPQELASNHPYYKNKDICVKTKDGLYYNPCEQKTRELIKNGIKEIIENYPIDGIQFDDYFYPTNKASFDKKQYNEYVNSVANGKAVTLKEWRIAQVNILIAEVYNIVHNCDKKIVFGISPQGNIDNDYQLCADVKSWCKKQGYIDYICPQIYYSLNHPTLSFTESLNQWLNLEYHDEIKLYIGLAGYKAGTDSDEGTWEKSNNILEKQLEISRKNKVDGIILYSFNDLERDTAKKEIENFVKLLN